MTTGERDPIAKKVAMADHKKTLENFDRFNEDFVSAYMAEKFVQRVKDKNKEKSGDAPLD